MCRGVVLWRRNMDCGVCYLFSGGTWVGWLIYNLNTKWMLVRVKHIVLGRRISFGWADKGWQTSLPYHVTTGQLTRNQDPTTDRSNPEPLSHSIGMPPSGISNSLPVVIPTSLIKKVGRLEIAPSVWGPALMIKLTHSVSSTRFIGRELLSISL